MKDPKRFSTITAAVAAAALAGQLTVFPTDAQEADGDGGNFSLEINAGSNVDIEIDRVEDAVDSPTPTATAPGEDAAIDATYSISGLVFNDLNGDGYTLSYGPEETGTTLRGNGIGNIQVTLQTADGEFVQNVRTTTNGYTFTNVAPGNYRVRVRLPLDPAFRFSQPAEEPSSIANAGVSDVAVIEDDFGYSNVFEVSDDVTNLDFGIYDSNNVTPPVEETPTEQPSESAPNEADDPTTDVETPVTETPVEETPVEETPVEETPVEETPVEETPVEETPVEETPVEETPVEETPVEETPVEETPVEETPVEETPVEETPVEETPVEETPVEEDADAPSDAEKPTAEVTAPVAQLGSNAGSSTTTESSTGSSSSTTPAQKAPGNNSSEKSTTSTEAAVKQSSNKGRGVLASTGASVLGVVVVAMALVGLGFLLVGRRRQS